MHLIQELSHVRACDCGEQDILQFDALHLSLCKVELMLQQLEQDVVLMQV